MTTYKQDGSESEGYNGRKGNSDWTEGDRGVLLVWVRRGGRSLWEGDVFLEV